LAVEAGVDGGGAVLVAVAMRYTYWERLEAAVGLKVGAVEIQKAARFRGTDTLV
jgi:hypothetical protein